MSKKKTLLEEGTVRRFMKLAEMAPLSTDFINEMYPPMADDDEAEEAVPADATPAEADYDEAEFEAGEEAGEEDAADEMDLELDMDDDPMTDEAASGELTLTDEEAEVFLKVADKVRAAMEAEGGIEDLPAPDMGDEDVEAVDMEMDAPEMGDDLDVDVEEEEEVELEEDMPYTSKKEKPGADMRKGADKRGAEATKRKTSGKGRGERKGDDAFVNEELVNEIASRVAKRVLKAKKK